MNFGFHFAKVKAKIVGRSGYKYGEIINDFFRKQGVKVGKRTLIYSNILTSEPYLISIGEDSVISTDVTFVTHDYSIHNVIPSKGNLFGEIAIGNNCFIGEKAIIMYGVSLANNVIVAAGSVVVNSFSEENIIVGGNPAKKIGTWEIFKQKREAQAYEYPLSKVYAEEHPEMMVRR